MSSPLPSMHLHCAVRADDRPVSAVKPQPAKLHPGGARPGGHRWRECLRRESHTPLHPPSKHEMRGSSCVRKPPAVQDRAASTSTGSTAEDFRKAVAVAQRAVLAPEPPLLQGIHQRLQHASARRGCHSAVRRIATALHPMVHAGSCSKVTQIVAPDASCRACVCRPWKTTKIQVSP
jgi:hypothetical protein